MRAPADAGDAATTDSRVAVDAAVDAPVDGGPDSAVSGSGCPAALGLDCRWSWRVRLTFDNSAQGEALGTFPVLVVLDSGVIDYAQTIDQGQDIRFVTSDLSTVLAHEIERWDETRASYVWLAVPRIEAGSATDHVYMYYGHPAAADAQDAPGVWDDAFRLVWHLTGSSADSTQNANGGRNMGSTAVAGAIAGARGFASASRQYVDSDYAEHLDVMTVEVWARGTASPQATRNVGLVGRNTNYQLNWDHFGAFRGAFGLQTGTTWHSVTYLPAAADTWYYLVGTYDGDAIRAYRDGSLVATNTDPGGSPAADTFPVRVGTNPDPSAGWFHDGAIDEVRISDVARSADWIAAQHLSMTNRFIRYGTPESVSATF